MIEDELSIRERYLHETLHDPMRTYESGATRDKNDDKFDYEGFLDPEVLEVYGKYMHMHRHQADGQLRDSDNWQRGMPKAEYMKSLLRHVVTGWKIHRGKPVKPERVGGVETDVTIEMALCGVMFNAMGYLHEVLREKHEQQDCPF